jgi:hypothetical protein
MGKLDWISGRLCGIHMTIRDIDCRDFDAARMARDFHELGVDFFSFFAAGYVTTYPSALPLQRVSPYLAPGRDLAGEIIREAHRYGIKAIAMADLGQLPEKAAVERPDWCALDRHDQPFRIDHEHMAACAMGGWQGEYAKLIVGELVQRYPDVDGIKFGGGSYGFSEETCYCANCRRSFNELTGLEIPREKNFGNPVYISFLKWRYHSTAERVKFLHDLVKSFDSELLVMGNSVCFGDPDWTLRSSLDQEKMARFQDAIQVEAQTRVKLEHNRHIPIWQSLSMSGEEANYMSCLTDRPIWIVASYFLAWPWRRSAMPNAEQRVWLYQIAANGASPMVNLSGGPPAAHEDPRGFAAIKEVYGFLRRNREYYQGDRSAATVALVYSQETLVFYGKDDAMHRYVECIRGFEQALKEEHIPFDIISSRRLTDSDLSKYACIVLPNLACMNDDEAAGIRRFSEAGGGLVASFETSLYDHDGIKRRDFLLADRFGIAYSGATPGPLTGVNKEGVLVQAYCRKEGRHPIHAGLEGTDILPVDGSYCAIQTVKAKPAFSLYPSFRVFPEGLSYIERDRTTVPMAAVADGGGKGGRTVYFASAIERDFWKVGYPDQRRVLADAVRWAAHERIEIELKAPPSLDLSLRRQPGRLLVHMINLSGGRRVFSEIVPVHNVVVTLKTLVFKRARLIAAGTTLDVRKTGSGLVVTVPVVDEYEILVLEE